MYMGVLAISILLTNSAPVFLEYGKNIPVHTLIAIDTMHAAGLHASYSQLESVLLAWSLCIMQCIAYGAAAFCRRTARQLCCAPRACRRQTSVGIQSLVKTLGTAREIAIELVVKFGATEVCRA
jgi:hypothetical protein